MSHARDNFGNNKDIIWTGLKHKKTLKATWLHDQSHQNNRCESQCEIANAISRSLYNKVKISFQRDRTSLTQWHRREP